MTEFVSKLPPVPKGEIPESYSFVVLRYCEELFENEMDCVMFQERQAHAYCEHMGEDYTYYPVINRIFGLDYNGKD